MQGALAGTDLTGMRPTSSYLCSHCKCQLFTNLDISLHEPGVKDDDEAKHSKSKKSRQISQVQVQSQMAKLEEPKDVEVATIIDFKGSRSAKSQFNQENLDKYLPI